MFASRIMQQRGPRTSDPRAFGAFVRTSTSAEVNRLKSVCCVVTRTALQEPVDMQQFLVHGPESCVRVF